jgi:hypothetical protein
LVLKKKKKKILQRHLTMVAEKQTDSDEEEATYVDLATEI